MKSESMSYVFEHSHMLTDTQRAELEAQQRKFPCAIIAASTLRL